MAGNIRFSPFECCDSTCIPMITGWPYWTCTGIGTLFYDPNNTYQQSPGELVRNLFIAQPHATGWSASIFSGMSLAGKNVQLTDVYGDTIDTTITRNRDNDFKVIREISYPYSVDLSIAGYGRLENSKLTPNIYPLGWNDSMFGTGTIVTLTDRKGYAIKLNYNVINNDSESLDILPSYIGVGHTATLNLQTQGLASVENGVVTFNDTNLQGWLRNDQFVGYSGYLHHNDIPVTTQVFPIISNTTNSFTISDTSLTGINFLWRLINRTDSLTTNVTNLLLSGNMGTSYNTADMGWLGNNEFSGINMTVNGNPYTITENTTGTFTVSSDFPDRDMIFDWKLSYVPPSYLNTIYNINSPDNPNTGMSFFIYNNPYLTIQGWYINNTGMCYIGSGYIQIYGIPQTTGNVFNPPSVRVVGQSPPNWQSGIMDGQTITINGHNFDMTGNFAGTGYLSEQPYPTYKFVINKCPFDNWDIVDGSWKNLPTDGGTQWNSGLYTRIFTSGQYYNVMQIPPWAVSGQGTLLYRQNVTSGMNYSVTTKVSPLKGGDKIRIHFGEEGLWYTEFAADTNEWSVGHAGETVFSKVSSLVSSDAVFPIDRYITFKTHVYELQDGVHIHGYGGGGTGNSFLGDATVSDFSTNNCRIGIGSDQTQTFMNLSLGCTTLCSGYSTLPCCVYGVIRGARPNFDFMEGLYYMQYIYNSWYGYNNSNYQLITSLSKGTGISDPWTINTYLQNYLSQNIVAFKKTYGTDINSPPNITQFDNEDIPFNSGNPSVYFDNIECKLSYPKNLNDIDSVGCLTPRSCCSLCQVTGYEEATKNASCCLSGYFTNLLDYDAGHLYTSINNIPLKFGGTSCAWIAVNTGEVGWPPDNQFFQFNSPSVRLIKDVNNHYVLQNYHGRAGLQPIIYLTSDLGINTPSSEQWNDIQLSYNINSTSGMNCMDTGYKDVKLHLSVVNDTGISQTGCINKCLTTYLDWKHINSWDITFTNMSGILYRPNLNTNGFMNSPETTGQIFAKGIAYPFYTDVHRAYFFDDGNWTNMCCSWNMANSQASCDVVGLPDGAAWQNLSSPFCVWSGAVSSLSQFWGYTSWLNNTYNFTKVLSQDGVWACVMPIKRVVWKHGYEYSMCSGIGGGTANYAWEKCTIDHYEDYNFTGYLTLTPNTSHIALQINSDYSQFPLPASYYAGDISCMSLTGIHLYNTSIDVSPGSTRNIITITAK